MATAAPAATAATATRNNPNWWRTLFASIMLAIILRAGLGIPFFTTFLAIGVIYLTHVVYAELGTGVNVTLGWVRWFGRMAMGLVVFLALRFLAAKVLGLYPVDTYNTVDDSGGFYWILGGHGVSNRILWEICFAFVAGGLVLTRSKVVGMVFVASLAILSLQIALPKVSAALPDKDRVSTTLVDHGVIGSTVRWTWAAAFGKPTPPPEKTATATTTNVVNVTTQMESGPSFIRATTPAVIHNVNYPFNIESYGKPLLMIYSDGRRFEYNLEKGCQITPPIPPPYDLTFADPNDEEDGHLPFRVYRIARTEAGCQ